ncbi:hypothetical protein AB0L85_29705 [Streptomyces sp. NPDC052051]|uniref:hypothetical protein n=1 Tax=Streptomyces sp. NPDC052051 TaxID=3154649 RepID=UPI00341C8128
MNNETDRSRPDTSALAAARAPRSRLGIRTAALSAALLTVGFALTACGGGDTDSGQRGSDSDVASLPTSSSSGGKAGDTPSTQSSDAAVEAKRPQERLDSSQKEIDQLWDTYWACLQSHGVPMNTARVAQSGGQAPPFQDQKTTDKYKAQYQACRYKMPLQPVEVRPETNPHYADDHRAYVGCIKAKGLKIHETFDSAGTANGWTFDDDFPSGTSEQLIEKADHDCLLEVFGGKGKK